MTGTSVTLGLFSYTGNVIQYQRAGNRYLSAIPYHVLLSSPVLFPATEIGTATKPSRPRDRYQNPGARQVGKVAVRSWEIDTAFSLAA